MPQNGKFGEVFRELVQDSRKSLNAISRDTGISVPTLSRYYQEATADPTASRLVVLADYFGVTVDFLLGRAEVANPDADIQAIAEAAGLSERAAQNLIGMKTSGVMTVLLETDKFRNCAASVSELIQECKFLSTPPPLDYDGLTLEETVDMLIKESITRFSCSKEIFEIQDFAAQAFKLSLREVESRFLDRKEARKIDERLDALIDLKKDALNLQRQIDYHQAALKELEAQMKQKNKEGETDNGQHAEN